MEEIIKTIITIVFGGIAGLGLVGILSIPLMILMGRTQRKKIKKLIENDEFSMDINEKLKKKLKRKENGSYISYKSNNKNYGIEFRKYKDYWIMVTETYDDYHGIDITIQNRKITKFQTNNNFGKIKNEIKQHFLLLEDELLETIDYLEEQERNYHSIYEQTEMGNLQLLKENLMMIKVTVYDRNLVHTIQVGNYNVKFSLQHHKLTLFINRGSENIYEWVYQFENQTNEKEEIHHILNEKEMDFFKSEIIPVVKNSFGKNETNEKEVESSIYEDVAQYEELEKEYQQISESYYQMSEQYQKENKELYEKALQKLLEKKVQKIKVTE